MAKSTLEWVAWILLLVGGINWGLYAFDINLVDLIFGSIEWLAMIVYILVGLSALWIGWDVLQEK